MPSWNEKPVTVPAINVNTKPCTCLYAHPQRQKASEPHRDGCPSTPVLIPLSMEPFRSVTFTVRLGECNCDWMDGIGHSPRCPKRPIRVSCSISGKTWAESEVEEVERYWQGPPTWRKGEKAQAIAVCRERWALVTALVTGHGRHVEDNAQWPEALFNQRGVVYAALADLARAEEAALSAQQRVDEAFPFARYRRNDADHRSERPSVGRLGAYVEHLVEQVGAL